MYCANTESLNRHLSDEDEWTAARESGETVYRVNEDDEFTTYEEAMECALDEAHAGNEALITEDWRWETPLGETEHDVQKKTDVFMDKHDRVRVFSGGIER